MRAETTSEAIPAVAGVPATIEAAPAFGRSGHEIKGQGWPAAP